MEMDFMGLNSKDSVIVVKEEAVEGLKEPVFSKASAVQWPMSSKISALPHFMSFKVAQEEKASKFVSDSSRSMALSTSDTFDTSHGRQAGEIQKNINRHRQGGTHFSMTAYPVQQSKQSVHLHPDVKMLQGSNQAVPVTMVNHFFKNQFTGAGQNFAGAPMKQQLLGGVPVTAPPSILPSISAFAGTTEPWFNSKASCAPAQLTIFYGGTVNVYEDISPEKAQAIMFLAGNGAPAAANTAQPRTQGQIPTSKVAAGDFVFVNQNQTVNTPPCSGLSSPISVSSHPVSQSGGGSADIDEPAKANGGVGTPINKVDSPRGITSLGPVTAATMMPSAVPQARKASLARFLEKRKERVMNSAPYSVDKKVEFADNPVFNGISFTVGSGAREQ